MPGLSVRSTVSALLAGVFLLSLGGEAFGWHECSHHHPSPRDSRAASAAGDTGRASDGPASAPLRPEGGPCTCVGSCHAAAASPLPAVASPTAALSGTVHRVLLRPERHRVRPRLSPYLLPYPTGPPPA